MLMVNPLLASADPVRHVIDKPLWQSADGSIWWVSNVTVMLVAGAVATAALVIPAARRIQTGHQRRLEDFRAAGIWANLVEVICLYLREDVFKPVLGDQTDRFCPMLWTFFWFILVCNLMGLIPIADITSLLGLGHHGQGIGGTATQSIWVTAALASISFLFWNGVALAKDPLGYLRHMTAGSPWFMWIIMVPVEIISTFIKPFALAIRLFANMTGGHLVLAVLLSFVGPLAATAGAGKGILIVPILGAVAINMLEILVALIQAFIFTFLTCLFLGQLVVHEHEERAHEGPDDEAAQGTVEAA